jgi:glucose-6-phosphate 1-dehydrogenase
MTPAETTSLVIFGASGDLTHRKLIPSLCNLYCKGRLPRGLNIVGVARRPLSDEDFRESLYRAMREADGFVANAQEWSDFSSRVFYVSGDVSSLFK